MSAIFGIINKGGRPELPGTISDVLEALSDRGREARQVWSENGTTLGVQRFQWEATAAVGGETLVLAAQDCVVVADATLYYRDELRRRIGSPEDCPSASHLILAAYRKWGEQCAAELEGDFAFVLWDRRSGRVVCGRDPSGVRPLHYFETSEYFVVASTIKGLLAHPECPRELDLANVALDAAGIIFAHGDGTCYSGVQVMPAGGTGVLDKGGFRTSRWWDPRVSARPRRISQDEAGEQLLHLLGDAVEQRFEASADPALWLSGGWDSPAVLAAGLNRMGSRAAALKTLSVSFPEGDSGREDEKIQALLDHWSRQGSWINGAELPLMSVSLEGAMSRDEPYTFAFEPWMRTLTRESRGLGSRIVLTGHGGNFLFESSPVFLSDLLARGCLVRLVKEWRAMGVPSHRARHLFKWALQPLLPESLVAAGEALRGKRLYGTYERPLPSWLRAGFVKQHGLEERARLATPRAAGGSRSAFELHWFMTHPAFARLNSYTFSYSLSEGIEVRAPLYDQRVIRFAAEGEWSERFSGGGSKRLLRHMMRQLAPPEVLAPRRGVTGTLQSYFSRSLAAMMPALYRLFERPVLADMGLLEPALLRRDLNRFAAGVGHMYLPEQLLSVAHVESWLQVRSSTAESFERLDPLHRQVTAV